MDLKLAMQQCPVIAILRGITPAEAPAICEALYEEGIRALEIPLNSPDPYAGIEAAVRRCGDKLAIGAGTVLTPEEVCKVASVGGSFIVSPNTDVSVIQTTKRLGLYAVPGFATATEGFTAIAAGADYLKLFPAGNFGPGYVKDLKAVIKLPILAVGGVGIDNLTDFLKVCDGAGIGGAIYKAGRSAEEVRLAARKLLALLK